MLHTKLVSSSVSDPFRGKTGPDPDPNLTFFFYNFFSFDYTKSGLLFYEPMIL